MYWILGAPASRFGGGNHLAPALCLGDRNKLSVFRRYCVLSRTSETNFSKATQLPFGGHGLRCWWRTFLKSEFHFKQIYKQGCRGGRRRNGVPTLFSCFALKWVRSCFKMASFLWCVPLPHLFFKNYIPVISKLS